MARDQPRSGLQAPSVPGWQLGVFTEAQALGSGLTRRQVRRRRESGIWLPLLGRGLVVAGQRPTFEQRSVAVALTWPNRVISHGSAAALFGWPVPEPGSVDVIGVRGTRVNPGLRVHAVQLAAGEWRRIRPGMAVTSEPRTAVDCLATLPMERALDLFAWLSTRRLLDRVALVAATEARRGNRGVEQLRELLELTRTGAVSGGEHRLHTILGAHGVTGWTANTPIRIEGRIVAVADVLFEAERLIVEFDGRRAHTGREAFVDDRRRQNLLQRRGFLVLRYTWRDLVDRPAEVAAEIHAVRSARVRRFTPTN